VSNNEIKLPKMEEVRKNPEELLLPLHELVVNINFLLESYKTLSTNVTKISEIASNLDGQLEMIIKNENKMYGDIDDIYEEIRKNEEEWKKISSDLLITSEKLKKVAEKIEDITKENKEQHEEFLKLPKFLSNWYVIMGIFIFSVFLGAFSKDIIMDYINSKAEENGIKIKTERRIENEKDSLCRKFRNKHKNF